MYLYLARDLDPVGPPYTDSDLDAMAFDPDEVTALVGLQPTAAWRRGDPKPVTRAPRRFGEWRYELPQVDTFDSEDAVIQLLDAIEPYAEGIAAARTTLGMRAGVMVVVSTSASIGYSMRTVQRLARLGLAIHHDQYVTG